MNVCMLGDLIAQMLERQGELRLVYIWLEVDAQVIFLILIELLYMINWSTRAVYMIERMMFEVGNPVHNPFALHKQHIENNSLMIGWSTIWDRSMYMSNQKLIDVFDL